MLGSDGPFVLYRKVGTSCNTLFACRSPTRHKCGGFSNKNCDLVGVPVAGDAAEPPAASSRQKNVDAVLAQDQRPLQGSENPRRGPMSGAAKMSIIVPALLVGSTTLFLLTRVMAAKQASARARVARQGKCKLDIHQILFTQSTIADIFRDGRPISDMIDALHSGFLKISDVPKIRVVRKHGQYFTLDHRRLYAFRRGLRDHSSHHHLIDVILESFKDPEIVKEFQLKCTTGNPHDITIEAGWMATWKPFMEEKPLFSKWVASTTKISQGVDIDDQELAASWGVKSRQVYLNLSAVSRSETARFCLRSSSCTAVLLPGPR